MRICNTKLNLNNSSNKAHLFNNIMNILMQMTSTYSMWMKGKLEEGYLFASQVVEEYVQVFNQ